MEVFKELLSGAGFVISWFLLVYYTVYFATRAWCKARVMTPFTHTTYNLNANSAEEAIKLSQRLNGAVSQDKPSKNAKQEQL